MNLQRFSISSSRIGTWTDIDNLATYENCRALRLSQIPLFTGKGSSEVRPIVIGRMKQLLFFNGSAIGPRERTGQTHTRSIYSVINTYSITPSLIHIHSPPPLSHIPLKTNRRGEIVSPFDYVCLASCSHS